MSRFSLGERRVERAGDDVALALRNAAREAAKNTAAGAVNGDARQDSARVSSYLYSAKPDDLSPEQIAALPPGVFRLAPGDAREAEQTGYSHYSYWGSTLRMFLANRGAVAALSIVIIIVLFTFIQPYLPRQSDPNLIHNSPETGMQIINRAPDGEFWFGTNSIGQDLWARIWSGARTSLFIGLTVAVIQAAIGILMGALWGYARKLDFLFTEIYNILNNIPTTIVLILASYILRPSVRTIILAMSFTSWIVLARFIRNLTLIIRDQDFNVASRCLGTGLRRIITRNLLPQMVSVIMLRVALSIPYAIDMEVFLTYIGLGVPIETPSLGNLINAGRILMMSPSLRYQLIFPAIVLSLLTICFYLTGNAFADAADPKNHR
ncbi:MAG: ABC transporter permease [Oscillospiraceae bacterium]|jgi:oligopeptide transport system permease protein|nr:ABC transporter permease [Oscillospiraceae bacterium]